MKTRLVSCLLFFLLQMTAVFAQTENWECDAYDYQYDMTVYIALDVDGSSAALDSYKVAAFCGEECRGVMEIHTHNQYQYGYLRVRSHQMENEKISFRVYDEVHHKLLKSVETIDFKSSAVIGFPSTPFTIHAKNRYAAYFQSPTKSDTVYFYYGDPVVAPQAPAKEGYTFKGWTPEVAEVMPAHDLSYDAVYEINVYAVTYNVDGQVFKTDSVTYGSPISVPAAPTKEGYTFKGWEPAVAEVMPAHDLSYEAVYEVNVYAVTYSVDGQVFQTDSVSYGAPVVAPAAPAKEGYTFKGWEPAVAKVMPAHDLSYEAVYEVNVYAVTYSVDGQVFQTDSVSYGAPVVVPAAPAKEGYTFKGWEPAVAEVMPAHDLSYEAVYEVNVYAVTYSVDGQVFQTDSVAYGASFVAPAAPAKEGYTFKGWNPTVAKVMPAHDLSYEAVYEVNSYKLTYYLNDSIYAEVMVEYGQEIVPLEVETTDEYEFTGWQGLPQYMPAHDVTVYGSLIATGIGNLILDHENCSVYSLKGELLLKSVPFLQLKHLLQRGVYIVNGKKMYIK